MHQQLLVSDRSDRTRYRTETNRYQNNLAVISSCVAVAGRNADLNVFQAPGDCPVLCERPSAKNRFHLNFKAKRRYDWVVRK